ncbi:MAG: hypothetical protein WCH36_05280 [Chitinophagaceae bacterium]
MKFIATLLLSTLLAYASGIYGDLPWFSFVITNLLVAIVLPQKPAAAFLSGAIGVGLLWAGLSIYMDISNNHILSTKVAQILPLGGSYQKLIFITVLVGFLLGGLASLTGSFIRNKKAAQ